jgi:hypothetical protein
MKSKFTLSELGVLFFKGYLIFVGVWLAFALSFDLFMIGVHFTNPDLETKISNEITWKIDGTFANDPNNIWYKGVK